MSDRGWKEYLLKSSLPLEQEVSRTLQSLNYLVLGEMSYSRANEASVPTEFSIDVLALRRLMRSSLSPLGLLWVAVECKYCEPGADWIFAPHPVGNVLDTPAVCIHQVLCSQRIADATPISDFGRNVPSCLKGVKVWSGGYDPNAMTAGVTQLRYAGPVLASSILQSQLNPQEDVEAYPNLTVEILVTNAPIYILKPGVTVSDVMAAKEVTDVADRTDRLVVDGMPGPSLETHTRDVLKWTAKSSSFSARIAKLSPSPKAEGRPSVRQAHSVITETLSACQRVYVVHIDALGTFADELSRACETAGLSLTTDTQGSSPIPPAAPTRT